MLVRKASLAVVLALIATMLGVVTAPSSGAVEKRFSVFCEFSHATRMDPIVAPGHHRRSDHRHVFFGNKSTRSHSTYRSMRAAPSTCRLRADTAAYWVPALVAPDGKHVRPHGAFAYYRSVGALADEKIRAFPKDLRMISDDFHFHCGEDRNSSPVPIDCSNVNGGKRLRLTVIFPACWDGRRKDSKDHMRHMAFPTGKGCPKTHPVALPRLAVIAQFDVQNAAGYRLSSGSPTTAHGDFWNTWHQRKLRKLVHRCLGRGVTELCGEVRSR
jgi:hypothetical protein